MQLSDTFSMVQVYQQSAALTQNGSITLQIPPNTYNLKKSRIQFLVQLPNVGATNFRIAGRKDCLPASLQCQIQLDGRQIMNVYKYWRDLATDKDQVYVASALSGADKCKKALQVCAVAQNAQPGHLYLLSYDFDHFFAGLFTGQEFLRVDNQLVITLQLQISSGDGQQRDYSNVIFKQENIRANSSNTAAITATNNEDITSLRMRALMCVPQQPPQIQPKFQTIVTQYSAKSNSSLNFTYVPQAGSVLYGLLMSFTKDVSIAQRNFDGTAVIQGFNGIVFPEQNSLITDNDTSIGSQLDLCAARVTMNGLQLIQCDSLVKNDFTQQLQAISTDRRKTISDADEAFVDLKVMNEQIQIQTNLAKDNTLVQAMTFYESIPVQQF